MADFELLGLNELAPDLRAPASGDSGVVKNLKITQGAATANGVVYVNGSGQAVNGAGVTSDGTTITPTGGIYLGGTTSANLLDDYEEGTWTPTYVTSGGSFTYSTQSGAYTKSGRQVFCTCWIQTSSATVGAGDVAIGGLPFPASASSSVRSGGGVGRSDGFSGDMPSSYFVVDGVSQIFLYYRASANGASIALDASDLNTGSGNFVQVFFSYFTD